MTYDEYIGSARWAILRAEALIRDGYRCRGCDTPENLEVHHRRYGEPHGTETVDALTTLCTECHHAITDIIRRRRYESRTHHTPGHTRIIGGAHGGPGAVGLQAFAFSSHRRLGTDLP